MTDKSRAAGMMLLTIEIYELVDVGDFVVIAGVKDPWLFLC